MLLKDFVTNSIYIWSNQKLQTLLISRAATINAVNFALNDIYTYEGKERTFMYHKKEITREPTDAKTIEIELPYPIKKLFILEDLNTYEKLWIRTEKEYLIRKTEPTPGKSDLKQNEVYFKPAERKIYLPNNDNKGYILHYVSFYNPIDWEDNIPIPEHFLGCLYDITMTYLYPINWQYWENKDANNYNKAQDQLVNLAKTDAFQLSVVVWNIH